MSRKLISITALILPLSLCGAYLFVLSHEDTKFAPGYSEFGLSSIKLGMTGEEVSQILGVPLRKDFLTDSIHNTVTRSWFINGTESTYIDPPTLDGPQRWWYSLQSDDTKNYKVRVLDFDSANRVIKNTQDYYVD
jgi:hypothetical protein